MPTPAYLEIKGEQQGLISENAGLQDEHKNEILVLAYSHKVNVNITDHNGLPVLSDQRMHFPLAITKNIDRSSPLLYSALCSGEPLTCKLKFYRTSYDGRQEHFFSINMNNALINQIEGRMPHCEDTSKARFNSEEIVSITYERIEWTHEIDSTTFEDTWRDSSF